MGVDNIMLILGGVGTLLVSLGGAAKWILTYIDEKGKAALESEKSARNDLKNYMDQAIQSLNEQLHTVMTREALYLRRVLQLEAYVQDKGMDLPIMEGWPPK